MALEPLNLSAPAFCEYLGMNYNRSLLISLRESGLVSFFKIGVKYMYLRKDAEKVQELLLERKISIKTDKGKYYITKHY